MKYLTYLKLITKKVISIKQINQCIQKIISTKQIINQFIKKTTRNSIIKKIISLVIKEISQQLIISRFTIILLRLIIKKFILHNCIISVETCVERVVH